MSEEKIYDDTNDKDDEIAKLFFDKLPKNYLRLPNVAKVEEVGKAIRYISQVVNAMYEDDDDKPQFKVELDPMLGSDVGLDIIVPTGGLDTNTQALRDLLPMLPEECDICIVPRTDGTLLLEFTFYDVNIIYELGDEPSDSENDN